jgi:hypothetical protein
MATTTNYGWTTPDDTALVKDGAAAIRTLGSSVDTTTKALNPSTTLGDIEYRSSTANTNTRLGIGSTGNVLTVAGGVPTWSAPAGGGKVLQVVSTTFTTATTVTGKTFASTGLTLAITPSLATSKVLVLVQLEISNARNSADSSGCAIRLKRGATVINSPYNASSVSSSLNYYISGSTGTRVLAGILPMTSLDSPATTSSTTYTVEMANEDASGVSTAQEGSSMSTITLLEIGA